jgi:hypothetical protein
MEIKKSRKTQHLAGGFGTGISPPKAENSLFVV